MELKEKSPNGSGVSARKLDEGPTLSRLVPASTAAVSTSSSSGAGSAVNHVPIIDGASEQLAMVMAPKPGQVMVPKPGPGMALRPGPKSGPGMALRPGLAGCRGLARTCPQQASRHTAPHTQQIAGWLSTRGEKEEAKEEEQQNAKKEERMMGDQVALAPALAAATVAVRQGGGARTCGPTAASTVVDAGSGGLGDACVSMNVTLITVPLRTDFGARATSRVARTRPGAPTAPLLAAAPCRGCAAGRFSRVWSRVCSALRRRGWVFQQVLAAGAFNLREAV